MKNELLQIGPVTIYGYGLMIAIGIIAAYIVAEKRAEKNGVLKESVFNLVLWCAIGGIIGSKILFIITKFGDILENPAILLNVTNGFVVYGGIIGGIFAGFLFAKHTKQPFVNIFDLAMPSVALGQAFGRIGCLLAGCCYGKETNGAFHIVFNDSKFAPNHVPLLPTQVISCVLNFIHFFILIYFAKKVKARGQVAALYLILYSAGRFILEFFRGDLERGNVGRLSTSQFIAIIIEIIGIGLWFYFKKKYSDRSVQGMCESCESEQQND